MEQAGAPAAEPEPGGLQPAGATEDGGVLWACSLNSPAPDPNDIRRHVSSLSLSHAVSLPRSHRSSLFSFCSSSSLPPAPAFSPLSFAATICLPLLCPPLCSVWVRKSNLSGGEGRGAPSHLAFNEQLLCVPPALTEPKWPTHFTLLGLDLPGSRVTDLMASLWNNTM